MKASVAKAAFVLVSRKFFLFAAFGAKGEATTGAAAFLSEKAVRVRAGSATSRHRVDIVFVVG